MRSDPVAGDGRRGFSLWMLLAVVAILVVGLYLAVGALAGLRSTRVRQGWTQTLGSRQEILDRWPARQANASALRVEALTAPLGIDIATRGHEGRARPERGVARAATSLKGDKARFLTEQLARSDRDLAPAPPTLTAYLDEHAAELEALRRHLIDGEVPLWEMSLETPYEAPVPNLLGHIELQKLLIADALVRSHAGDRAGALADLDASWQLNRSLRDSPILITQLIAVAAVHMQAGALRQIDDVPEPWQRRLLEHDFRRSLEDTLLVEGWTWSQVDEYLTWHPSRRLWQRIGSILARPYFRYQMADVSREFLRRTENLRRLDHLCDGDLGARDADLDIPVPLGNVFGELAFPHLGEVVGRVARLEVDLELTVRLLRAEAARRDRGGIWPDALPEIEPSSACPGDRWVYRVTPDGDATLALDRDLAWPTDAKGSTLSTRFTLGSRNRAAEDQGRGSGSAPDSRSAAISPIRRR